jgi:hypothetical protein
VRDSHSKITSSQIEITFYPTREQIPVFQFVPAVTVRGQPARETQTKVASNGSSSFAWIGEIEIQFI